MAVLNEVSRVEVWADLMRQLSNDGDSIGINKVDLRAAVNALDDFMDNNEGAVNSALPQQARSALTVQQKALLLSFVVLKRYKVI
jgi:hypothetical protein